MSVIQSKINKPFTKELLESFLDEIEDYKEEQLNFERGELGMHAGSEDLYNDWRFRIESVVEMYHEDLDLFDLLDLELDKKGRFIFEDALEDIANSYEISVENHLAQEKLKTYPNSHFINKMAISFMASLEKKKDMDVEQFFNKEIETEEEYNKIFVDIIEDFTLNKIKEFFNKDTLNKNPLYKHVAKLVKENIESDYNEAVLKNEKESIKRPYHFKHSKDPDVTYKEVKDVLEMHSRYINLIKNKAKLPKDDPNYFSMLEVESFEEMHDGLTKMVKRSELEKFVKRFVGSYKHLLNEESMERFEEIKKRGIDEKKIRYNLSKISLMEDSGSLNSALDKVMANTSSFDFVKMTIDNDNLNAPIIYEDKRFLVVAMLDFEASKKLSASSWCISNSSQYFSQYSRDDNVNISIYDNRSSYGSSMSQLGITINELGEVSYAFDKNNKNIKSSVSNMLGKILPEITQAIKHKEDFQELMKFKQNLESFDVTVLKNPVFVINRLEKEYLSKCNFSELEVDSAINIFRENNQRKNVLTEEEVKKELEIFEKLIKVYSPEFSAAESSIKDYINNELLDSSKKEIKHKRIRP